MVQSKMEKKLFVIALLVIITAISVHDYNQPMTEIIVETHSQTVVATLVKSENENVIQQVSMTASAAKQDMPAEQLDFSKEKYQAIPGLPKGIRYLPHVKAIESHKYQNNMGPKIFSRNGMDYFRTHKADSAAANVVYNQRKNTLSPLTATIKLSGIDQNKRQDLNKGLLSEFYYHEDLGIQYLQSSHQSLISDLKLLKDDGHDASLEMVEAVYITK